jgi:hypothetical protein
MAGEPTKACQRWTYLILIRLLPLIEQISEEGESTQEDEERGFGLRVGAA